MVIFKSRRIGYFEDRDSNQRRRPLATYCAPLSRSTDFSNSGGNKYDESDVPIEAGIGFMFGGGPLRDYE